MPTRLSRWLGALVGAAAFATAPTRAAAQQVLVYCPPDEAPACATVAAAIGSVFPGGTALGYDGSGETVNLATADLAPYAVLIVPSLADGADARPSALLRDGPVAARLRAAFGGRTAVWSGTPDQGSTNRAAKDALLRNLATWAMADTAAGRGAGIVALQDNSDDAATRYGWLDGIAGVSVGADTTLESYANVEVVTATGRTILTNAGLQIGYTNMASFGLIPPEGSGATVDATGGRTSRAVLVTWNGGGAPGDGIATVRTDREDYQPGETVVITGTGWEPGETVAMTLHEDPVVHGDRTLSAVADDQGNIFNDSFSPEEHDVGVRFVLSATGQTSGRTAQTTFTDGNIKVNVLPSADGFSVQFSAYNGNATCTDPATSSGSEDAPHTFSSNNGQSIKLTAPTTSDAGGTFTQWTGPSGFTSASPTICISGFATGTRDYTAVYTSVPDLTINKSHSGNFTVGTNGTYTLAVSNAGTAATAGTYTVTDVLPTGLTYVSATGTGWACTHSAGTVTCTRSTSLTTSGGGRNAPPITLTVAVGAAAFPSVTNTASVSGGGEGANTANNSDSDPTTVLGTDLTIDKSHTGSFATGTNGTYSISVSNVGTLASAGTYTVTDAMPTGLTYVSASGTGWSCNAAPAATVTCTRSTSLTTGSPGNTAPPITLTVAVGAAAAPSVTNTATVSGAGDVNAANNSDSDPTSVNVGNTGPTVDAGGQYGAAEGSAVALSGATASGSATPLVYKWTYAAGIGVDAGATCSFTPDAQVLNPSVTCTDDGSYTLTLSVTDADGITKSDNAALTVTNAAPAADAGGPYSGNEGAAISLNGSLTDPGSNDTHAWSWVYVAGPGVDAGATCSFSNAAVEDPTIMCTDDGTVQLTLTVTDDDGGQSSDAATLTIANVAPIATAGGPYTGNEGSAIPLGGSATDAGSNDALGYKWTVDVTGIDTGGNCTFDDDTKKDANVTCTDDGSFTLTLVVTDDDGAGSVASTATLTVENAAPVANAGPDYTGTEGSPVQLNGSLTDVGANDTHTWSWTYLPGQDVDPGASCSFSSTTAEDPTITCTDDGAVKVTLTVKDDDGAQSSDEATVTLANANPVATAGGPYSGDEGAAIQLAGSADDPGNNDDPYLTYLWTVNIGGIDAGGACTFDDATKKDAKVTCTDDGSFTLTLAATDDDGGTGTSTATLTVTNVAPLLGAITAPLAPVNIGSPVVVSAPFTDQGKNDTHTGLIDWGDGTSAATVTETPGTGAGTASGTHTYGGPGVYTIKMTVTDDDGAVSNESIFQYVVVYDPSAGFVTGGGWINSPVGAYVPEPTLVGKANFGFVSKYQKGAQVPTGNTEFQFHAAGLNFKSTSYQWLVVQGSSKASYKGDGTINGSGGYSFMLSVVDGGNTGDKFRIKIWDKATNVVMYDNQMGGADDAVASQLIANGSIVIHTNGGLASK